MFARILQISRWGYPIQWKNLETNICTLGISYRKLLIEYVKIKAYSNQMRFVNVVQNTTPTLHCCTVPTSIYRVHKNSWQNTYILYNWTVATLQSIYNLRGGQYRTVLAIYTSMQQIFRWRSSTRQYICVAIWPPIESENNSYLITGYQNQNSLLLTTTLAALVIS